MGSLGPLSGPDIGAKNCPWEVYLYISHNDRCENCSLCARFHGPDEPGHHCLQNRPQLAARVQEAIWGNAPSGRRQKHRMTTYNKPPHSTQQFIQLSTTEPQAGLQERKQILGGGKEVGLHRHLPDLSPTNTPQCRRIEDYRIEQEPGSHELIQSLAGIGGRRNIWTARQTGDPSQRHIKGTERALNSQISGERQKESYWLGNTKTGAVQTYTHNVCDTPLPNVTTVLSYSSRAPSATRNCVRPALN
ncbi:hypothetical protein DFH07DRAFT_765821 [Mycena maculata]|uniref:Uncharacterized protein n=1 Tax=Mycena maculata TaxID=230809 RepID=A0AAD7K570_9AGAR|nr:hypothetical protein DFH07DRAFT_765821 [Mycena maculata]